MFPYLTMRGYRIISALLQQSKTLGVKSMKGIQLRFTIIFLIFTLSRVVFADSWPEARSLSAIDGSGRFVVKVYPGDSIGDTYGFSGAPKGKYASIEVYRLKKNSKSFILVNEYQSNNPISPVFVFVSNKGFVTTIDNWHNIGIKKMLSVYDNKGQLKVSYSLNDIFENKELKEIGKTTSSVWWRCGDPFLDMRQNRIIVKDFMDGEISIDPNSGKFTRIVGKGSCGLNN